MGAAKLHQLLLGRAFRSRFHQEDATSIGRRQFLTRTTTVGAAALAFGLDPLTPHLVRRGDALLVLYGGHVWRIDPGTFGAAARVDWQTDDRDLVIDLKDARLPGTDLDVSFRARLRRGISGWRMRFTMPRQGFDASVALRGWLAEEEPLTNRVSTRQLTMGSARVDGLSRSSLTIRPSFGFRFGGDAVSLRCDGPFACDATGLTLDVMKPAAATLREATLGITVPATHFALTGARVAAGPIALGHGGGLPSANCCADAVTAVSGEAFTRDSLDEALFVLEGQMRVFGGGPELPADAPSQVRLEHAALMTASGRDRCEWALAGRVSRIAHALEVDGCQFLVAGDDERPFYVQRSDRGGPIRVQARVERVSLPLAGATTASLSAGNDVVDVVIPDQEPVKTPLEPCDPPLPGLILLGRQPSAVLSLDSSRLTIRRGIDLVNLTFAFTGFDLRVKDGTPWLLRRRPAGKKQEWPPATVSVTFPPQHVAEQFTDMTEPHPCKDTEKLPDLSRARLSAPSRVVFDLCRDPRKPQWTEQPLSIEQLTDWSELALQVHDRALEPDAPFEKQRQVSGVTQQTTLAQLPAVLAAQMCAPKDDQTALTMSGRLVLSPSRSGRFTTPRVAPDPAAAPLWHARLDPAGRKTVRAIWSEYLTPGSLTAPKPEDDHMLPLSSIHHWDIVAQTSLYLLPARRQGMPQKEPRPEERERPRSRVVRPDVPFASLTSLDEMSEDAKSQASGFAMPQPFENADILLTSVGGSLVANWHAEPPTLLYLPDQDSRIVGFSLERLEYWSQLGRDIRVEAVDKGYMLPLGIRCSHIELVERRFYRHHTRHDPVAYLIKRQFIVFGKPDKNYPGEGQPFAGRDFPPRKVTMLTRKTPDLLPPEQGQPETVPGSLVQVRPGGRVEFPDEPFTFKIFWPRTPPPPGATGDYEFKWSVDGTPTPVTSHLLFVENRAVSIGRVMSKVVAYYRSLTGERSVLRTAQLSGARREYAPSRTDGDTAFDTATWLLSASGRLSVTTNNVEREQFEMDAPMEGADQPPFYPFVEQTAINVQSLDRLLGRPQGLIRAAYTPEYIRHGFNTTLNPSEIYLNVLSPEIALDVTSQGNSTGGVAKPNALVVALSRKSGPVGGARAKPGSAAQPVAAPVEEGRQVGSQGPFDFTQALSGRFDPAEFFGGLGSAKLLGLIPLKDVLSVVGFDEAPKLLEEVGYGVGGTLAEALDLAKDIFRRPIQDDKNLAALVNEAVTALDQPFEGIRFQDLYPVLYQRLSTFNATLTRSTATILGASSILEIGAPLTAIVRDGRAVADEVERTLKYPLPAIVQATIDTLAREWKNLKTLLNGEYLRLARELLEEVVREALIEICREVEASKLGGVLFGLDPSITCERIVDDPAGALTRVEASLFSEFFGEPLVRMLRTLRGIEAEANARIAWHRAEFVRLVKAAVAQAAEALKTRLATVLSDPDQQLFVDRIVDKYAAAVAAAVIPPAIPLPAVTVAPVAMSDAEAAIEKQLKAVLDSVDRLLTQLQSDAFVRDAVNEVRAAHGGVLEPRNPADAANLVAEFTNILIDRARLAAESTIGVEARALRAVLLTQVQKARAQAIERVLQIADEALTAMVESIDFAGVTSAVRQVAAWCRAGADKVPPVFAVGEAILTKLIDTGDHIDGSLQELGATAGSIPVGVNPRVDHARASLLASIQQFADLIGALKAERTAFSALKDRVAAGTLDVCAAPGEWLPRAQGILTLRRQAIERLAEILDKITNVEQALSDAPSAPVFVAGPVATASASSAGAMLLQQVRALLQQLTSLGEVGLPGAWTTLKETIEGELIAGADRQKLGPYIDRLRGEIEAIEARALAINQTLSLAADPAQLRAAANEVLAYAIQHDKRLAAVVLQTVAFTQALQNKVQERATGILRGIADPIHTIHVRALSLLDTLNGALETPPANILLNPDITARLKTESRKALHEERLLLQQIMAATPDTVVVATRELLARWDPPRNPPALVRVLATLADIADSVLKGDLKAVANLAAIRQRLEPLAQQIRDAVAELIPTRVQLGYTWKTSLGPFPASDPIFEMIDTAPDDLQLRADIAVDLISQTRSAIVRGSMRPFRVRLLGSSIKVAVISFSGASFESRDGSSPKFAAEVSGVELGDLIKFLKPLQDWLSPEGNGFYVKPVLNPPAIEAGYRFYTDVIPLGAILFLNVGLSVSALLPFTDTPATFKFAFASPERPFMIVAPPYGGGGYVSIVANAKGVVEFRLSFVFGAVVPIKFGPLSAQGRVVAGVYAIQRGDSRTIGALIEAAGEGHIACFSISVCLRVGLEHQSDSRGSRLTGYAEFSFEFSIGFASITFHFRASYTANNDKSSPVDTAAVSAPLAVLASLNPAQSIPRSQTCEVCKEGDPFVRIYRIDTPRKAVKWQEYRERIAMDLI